jgi:hypothetical protein
MSYKYEESQVYTVDNTKDEILNAVIEFHDIVMNGKKFSEEETSKNLSINFR